MKKGTEHFKTLGLEPDATVDEVRGAWQRLAGLHHPDRGGDTEKFIECREAYFKALAIAAKPVVCSVCGGKGKAELRRGFNVVKMRCKSCRGTGHVERGQ